MMNIDYNKQSEEYNYLLFTYRQQLLSSNSVPTTPTSFTGSVKLGESLAIDTNEASNFDNLNGNNEKFLNNPSHIRFDEYLNTNMEGIDSANYNDKAMDLNDSPQFTIDSDLFFDPANNNYNNYNNNELNDYNMEQNFEGDNNTLNTSVTSNLNYHKLSIDSSTVNLNQTLLYNDLTPLTTTTSLSPSLSSLSSVPNQSSSFSISSYIPFINSKRNKGGDVPQKRLIRSIFKSSEINNENVNPLEIYNMDNNDPLYRNDEVLDEDEEQEQEQEADKDKKKKKRGIFRFKAPSFDFKLNDDEKEKEKVKVKEEEEDVKISATNQSNEEEPDYGALFSDISRSHKKKAKKASKTLIGEELSNQTSQNSIEVDLESLDLPPDTTIITDLIGSRRGRKENGEYDSTKVFHCKFCSRRFKRQEHLKRHFRSLHTFEKPYHCKICNKKFSRADNLNQHVKTHKPE